MGEKGSVTFSQNSEIIKGIFPVKPLKPTGAGDSFMGSLIGALLKNYDLEKIVLPPATYRHEKAKFDDRLPAARRFAQENSINEFFPGDGSRYGIITQGGTYTVVLRALRRLGMADAFGKTEVPILCLNLVYPLIPEEIERGIGLWLT